MSFSWLPSVPFRVLGLLAASSALAFAPAFAGGCGGGSSATGSGGGTDGGSNGDDGGTDDGGDTDGGGGGGPIKTVFLILMENHNWATPSAKEPDIIKGSASAPYINGTLLPKASYCENYYDNPKKVHPSEPNYIWLEAGDNLGITTDDDPAITHQATTQHLVTLLKAAGVSWRSYQEAITADKCPLVTTGLYGARHNPMVYFDDVVGSPPSPSAPDCVANVRPYSELASDLANDKVARYNFITPDVCHDMHDDTGCATSDPVKNGDTWLAAEVPKILASRAYKDNGALFITWDESEGGEYPIGMIVLSPKAKGGGYVSKTKYYHSSMLRTVQEIFGVTPLLRDAANQPDLSDLFTSFP